MQFLTKLKSFCFILVLTCQASLTTAQTINPKDAVQEIAALNADIMQIEAIKSISEEIVYWQSVAIMGSEYGWQFEFNDQGANIVEWTYRLYNTLDETALQGVRAKQSIARSRVLTDSEKANFMEIFAKYEEMRVLGEEIYDLLRAGETETASVIFESQTLNLRREISIESASAMISLRNRISDIALDVLMGR